MQKSLDTDSTLRDQETASNPQTQKPCQESDSKLIIRKISAELLFFGVGQYIEAATLTRVLPSKLFPALYLFASHRETRVLRLEVPGYFFLGFLNQSLDVIGFRTPCLINDRRHDCHVLEAREAREAPLTVASMRNWGVHLGWISEVERMVDVDFALDLDVVDSADAGRRMLAEEIGQLFGAGGTKRILCEWNDRCLCVELARYREYS
jgi:hypothetical protein